MAVIGMDQIVTAVIKLLRVVAQRQSVLNPDVAGQALLVIVLPKPKLTTRLLNALRQRAVLGLVHLVNVVQFRERMRGMCLYFKKF
ncbi:MAG: hypothetical protein HYW63_04480 [Candidatus Levybacteria bacterium]|nr:hypothetical protein [Candidatus Levybacteria bacterium]